MGKEDQAENTTNKELDGVLKTRSRKVVKCFICSSNHYADRFKHKNSNEDNQDSTNTTMSNKDDSTVSGETTIASSSNNTLSVEQTPASASANVTTSQGEDEYWDQNVDYSGLVFLHNTSSCNEKPEELEQGAETNLKHIVQHIDGDTINSWWTLLDNQSMVDVLCNG